MWHKIIGHENQKDQLKKAIASGNIPHAYLLSGIDGIGKRLVAKTAARALLCNNLSDDTSPCEKCTECRMIEIGSHPDLIEIEPEDSNIAIDTIRGIKEQLKFPPYQSNKRTIIIDQAEAMNPNAANAALKILEEPPANNHFFLVTSTPTNLLPTIISRCQKIDFSPLSNKQIKSYLISNLAYSPEQAKTAAEVGEGSIERTLKVTPELIDSVSEDLTGLLRSPTASQILELSVKWASLKDDIGNILYIIHRCFHNTLLYSTSPSPNLSPKGRGIVTPSPYGGERSTTPSPLGGEGWGEGVTQLILKKNDTSKLIDKCNMITNAHFEVTKTYNKQLMFERILFTLAS